MSSTPSWPVGRMQHMFCYVTPALVVPGSIRPHSACDFHLPPTFV